MQPLSRTRLKQAVTLFVGTAILAITPGLGVLPTPAFAQYAPGQLENLVSRIALYPDPLLAQILAAATYPNDIPPAAQWANEHSYLKGEQLAQAIEADHLPWDPSVQALLPFPNVLNMMAGDMGWTSELGNAFLSNRDAVMDAVQRERHRAMQYGYLRSGGPIVVTGGPYVEILPATPGYIVVPTYNPAIVFAPPRPGFYVGGAINFGIGFSLGAAFRPWGWGGYNRIGWANHAVVINNYNWNRTMANRNTYVHHYDVPRYRTERPVEHHQIREHERRDERGREREHDHR
ncbi:MAG TPA: DUF3300 domain-containing protein [Bryobacteraceae bacterium]|nr:DUF3300 domain-containing protein [Bryobacteraceae bacterium]